MKKLVAAIPPHLGFDAALAAMHGLAACYPKESLSLANDPNTGGMLILHDPSGAAGSAGEPESTLRVELRAEEIGDLLSFAFTVTSDDEQEGLRAVVAGMAGLLENAGAANFLALTGELPDVGRYAVTIQRCGGKTPAERIGELEETMARITQKCQRWVDVAERGVGAGEYGLAGRKILALMDPNARAVWDAWNALPEDDRSPVKRIAKQLGLAPADVARIVYPEGMGRWSDDQEPDLS